MEKVNRQLITEKSDVVVRCLNRVRHKCPDTLEGLESDIDAQDIIILNLERAIQACIDIASHLIAYTDLPAAPTMADSFRCLHNAQIISKDLCARMVKAAGLRNLLVHEYKRIDWNIVWQVITKHLSDPTDFVQAVLAKFP